MRASGGNGPLAADTAYFPMRFHHVAVERVTVDRTSRKVKLRFVDTSGRVLTVSMDDDAASGLAEEVARCLGARRETKGDAAGMAAELAETKRRLEEADALIAAAMRRTGFSFDIQRRYDAYKAAYGVPLG